MITLTLKAFDVKIKLINQIDRSIEDKTTYALTKFDKIVKNVISKQGEEIVEKYSEMSNDFHVDLASVDKDGNLLKGDDGKFLFTKENQKLLNKKSAELTKDMDNEVISFEPYISTEIREGLDEDLVTELTGIIF